MRIIHFIESLRSGGKERQLLELLTGLASIPGVENELIVMSDDIHYSSLKYLNVPIFQLPRTKRHDPALFFKLFSLLRKRKPDILHSWGSMCSLYALPCVKLLRIKFVNGFVRGAGPSLSFRHKNWRRARLTFPFSDAIITNSKAGLTAYQAPPGKSYCIYNGFDMQRVNNLPDKEGLKKNMEFIPST